MGSQMAMESARCFCSGVSVNVSLARTCAKNVFSKWFFDDMTADSGRGLQAGPTK